MSPQIHVDNAVFEALKEQAIPFEDREPNDVLRRLLLENDAEPAATPAPIRAIEVSPRQQSSRTSTRSKPAKRKRAPSSTLMPETKYRYPILRVISDNGGRIPTSEAVAAVGRIVRDELLPADLEMLGKKPRWEARVQFTRLRLIEEGLMKQKSPRGVWEISKEGEKLLQLDEISAKAVIEAKQKMAEHEMAGAR